MQHVINQGNATDSDVLLLRPLVDTAVAVTIDEFADLGSAGLLAPAKLSFVLLVKPPPGKGWDYAEAITLNRVGRIQVLAPSAHASTVPGEFPRDYDLVWYHRNLIHECTGAFIWLFSAQKQQGWRLSAAPSWFVQGLQEYVAVERSWPEARVRYQAKYLPRLGSATVADQFSSVSDDYADGYLVLRFMHAEYGARAIHLWLSGTEHGFWEAATLALGESRATLYGRWLRWRAAMQQ